MRMVMLMSLIMSDATPPTLAELDARLREVEAIQEMMLRILARTKPLDNVLEQYGATDTQERACYALLDDLAARTAGRENERPTFSFFEMKMGDIFPALRKDREFLRLIIDTLEVERPVYRTLHAYMAAHHWGEQL